MQRLLWIARHEYRRHVLRRGFLITTLGMPLVLLGGLALVVLLILGQKPEHAIGYVDQAGVIGAGAPAASAESGVLARVPLVGFPSAEAAQAALLRGQIDAYLVIPPDYRTSAATTLYARERLSRAGESTLRDALRAGLLASQPAPIAARTLDPIVKLTRRTLSGEREAGPNNVLLFLMPTLFGMLFMIAVFFSAGTLLMGLIEEKENRTMEIVMTSIAPWQLVGGKTVGLGLLGLTQTLVWVLCGAGLWALGASVAPALRAAALPLDLLLVAALFFIPGYLLYAGCMIGISAMVTSTQEGQQISSVLSLLALSPFFANFLFVTDPNGVVPLVMSFFPLSAPIAMVMRLPLADVPAWQVALSLLIVIVSAALAIWAAARLFRIGMLRYGQRIRLRDVIGVLRAGYAASDH